MPRPGLITALAFCLLSANSWSRGCQATPGEYYEEIYCQLYNRNKTAGLPSIHEFRKNDKTTQANLLKRPAERAGIELQMPKKKSVPVVRQPFRSPRT